MHYTIVISNNLYHIKITHMLCLLKQCTILKINKISRHTQKNSETFKNFNGFETNSTLRIRKITFKPKKYKKNSFF